MKRIGPAAIYVIVFILMAQVLFPHLMPTDNTLPATQIIEGQTSFARQQWLDGLAFEVILDSSIRRFGLPTLNSNYLSGGTYIVGDPRDGTLSPLTWAAIFMAPLARMKIKVLLALLAGFLSVVFFSRKHFGLGRTMSLVSGILFLTIMRFWTSLVEHPLDAGILFTLPAMTLVWINEGRARNAVLAAVFAALAFFQTGVGAAAVVVALMLFALALKLSSENGGAKNPGRDMLLVICFAILFASIKLFPMVEAFHSARTFWAHSVEPTVRISSLRHFAFSPVAMIVKVIFALFMAVLWMVRRPDGAAGAICIGSFAFLAIVPDWGTLSGGWYGDSKLPGPIDSPERFFFPFFAFFAAVSVAMASQGLKNPKGVMLFLLLLGVGVVVAIGSVPFRKLLWEPTEKPFDFSSIKKEDNSFFQIRTWPVRKKPSSGESLHPALLAAQDVGVVDPKMMYNKRFRVSPRFRILRKPIRKRQVRSYRGEFYGTSRRIEILKIEDWGNRMRFSIKSEGPGHVVVNRNFDNNWKGNGEIENYRGQLGIKIKDPGETVIEIKYRYFTFIFGMFVTLISIFLAILFSAPWRKKPSRNCGFITPQE